MDRLIILGSAKLTSHAASFAREHGVDCHVFLGPRAATIEGDVRKHNALAHVTVCESLKAASPSPYDLATEAAVLLSLGSPFIVSQALLDLYRDRAFNMHNAPLPEHRGGGDFSWRIMAGDRRGRTCIHHLDSGIDTGDIALAEDYIFPGDLQTPEQWHHYAVEMASRSLRDFLEALHNGSVAKRVPQDHARSTYFPRLHTDTQAWIDWSWTGSEIERFVHAFSRPYGGAMTLCGNAKVRILTCRFEPVVRSHAFFAGIVVREPMTVATRDGLLVCTAFDGAAKVGDRLVTPREHIERAMQARPVYTPSGLK